MMTMEKRSEKRRLVEEYLEKYDPRQSMVFGYSIPDMYRYAKSVNKRLEDLTEEEISQFSTSR